MGKPFEKTMELINTVILPNIDMLKSMEDPDIRLAVLSMKDFADRIIEVDEAMRSQNRKVALFEFGLTPQLFYAFDCAPLCMETFPGFFTESMKEVFFDFVEAAEAAGVPSDVCSTDRFIVGAALRNELPDNSFFVTSSAPCDGTRIVYPMLKKLIRAPMLFLEAPYTYDKAAAAWYGNQIKTQLVPFLEEVTKQKFNPDRFREVIEESNRAYELILDLYDAYRAKPCPQPAAIRGMAYSSFLSSAGHPEHTEFVQNLYDDMILRLKEGYLPTTEEKHRVLWIHVPPNFDNQFFTWMETELGASVLASSLSATPVLSPIDTTDIDSMFTGYAWQGLDMTMSLMRFDTKKMIDFHMKAYHQYLCDCIIVTQHVGCNSICGAAGLMRKHFIENDIPALFLEMDYNDERIIASGHLKEQVSDFFTTVMA